MQLRVGFPGRIRTWVSKSAARPQAAPLPVAQAGGGGDLQKERSATEGQLESA